MSSNLIFSIILPCLNSQKYIERCLTSLKCLNFSKHKYEIILVDNCSKDKTLEIAKTFKVKILQSNKLTIAALRNLGAKHAKGKILAFTDSDCVVDKNWLKKALPYFSYPKIGCVGNECNVSDKANLIEQFWVDSQKVKKGYVDKLPGGNLFIKKDLFDKVGGFDETLTTGEDPDLCYRVTKNKYKIIADPKIRVIHLRFPKTIIQFIKKQYWYGTNTLDIALKHGLKSRHFKTFLFAIFSLFSSLGLLVSMFLLFYDVYSYFLIFIFILLITPIILAFKVFLKSKNLSYFFLGIVLYLIYGVVRGVSITKNLKF